MKDLVDVFNQSSPGLEDNHPVTARQRKDSVMSGVSDTHEKGSAQTDHREEVDLGWNVGHKEISDPLIGGLGNEDVWILIRRFNKVSPHQATT